MKNLKSVITNSLTILLSILILAFLGVNAINVTGTFIGTNSLDQTSYNFINFDTSEAEYIFLALAILFATILTAVMILIAILNLLSDFNVIKNKKFAKALQITNIVVSVLTVVCLIVGISIMSDVLKDFVVGSVSLSLSWAPITTLFLSIVVPVTAILTFVFAKAKKTKKKGK